MKTSLIVLLAVLSSTSEAREFPIEPAYAAKQERITNDSLQYEIDQFMAIADWNNALDGAVIARTRAKLLKRRHERTQELLKSQQATIEAGVTAKFLYEQALLEAERLEAEAEEAKAMAVIAKLKLQQEGKEGSNLLKELTLARIEVLKARIAARKAGLRCTLEEHRINELKLNSGHSLYDRKSVPQADLDLREFNTQNALERAAQLENHIRVAEEALRAQQMTLERL